MSKHIYKNVILIGIILLFCGCEHDDIVKQNEIVVFIPKNELRVQTKTNNQVSEKVIMYLKEKTNNSFYVNYNKNAISLNKNDSGIKNTSFGIVNTETEIVVANQHNTKHTFKVENVSQEANVIVNIVIVETATLTYEYFLKYTFEGSIPYDYSTNTIDLSKFSGTIETFTSEGDLSGSMDIEDGEVTQINGQTSPCPDEVTPTDTTNNDNNSTSSSSNSTGIPGEGSNDTSTQNSTNNTSNSSGGWVQGDGPCGLNYTYICSNGYGGDHDPTTINSAGNLCSGTNNGAGILTVTDCNGTVLATENTPKGGDTISNPCAGTVGVLISVEEAHQKNCEELKKLLKTETHTKPSNTKYANEAIADTKNGINNNTEYGYSLMKNSEGNTYAQQAQTLGKKVRYRTTPNVFGGVHAHQNDGIVIPMFSPEDIRVLLGLKEGFNNGNTVNNSLFVHVLATFQFIYAIKIEDLSKLEQLNDIYADEDDANGDGVFELKRFKDKYKSLFDDTVDNSGNFLGSKTLQKAFLRFVTEKYDLGISLYKLEEPVTSTDKPKWRKLTLEGTGEDSIVKEETPCPE